MSVDLATLGLAVDSRPVSEASKDLERITQAAGKAEKAADSFGSRTDAAGKKAAAANDNVYRSTDRLAGAYTRLARIITGLVVGAFSALSLRQFTAATVENERAQAQLAAAIASTGGAAQRSVAQLNEHAAALQRVTIFGDEAINAAQGLLLTFTQVRGDTFDRATSAITDMATAMRTDLRTAAMQVGRALNDPVRGVQALTRSGIQFSDAQRDTIKQLVETNRLADAQAIILKELETQFGGSARAARDTLGGALQSLRNAWGDLFELSGRAVERLRLALEGLIAAIQNPAFVAFVQTIGAALFGAFELAIRGATLLVNGINVVVDNIDTLAVAVTTLGVQLGIVFAPAIFSAIVAGFGTIMTAGVTAIRAITAAMAANPLGALIVGITLAVTAIYHFRDEIKQAIGVDVVQVARDAMNTVIGAFVGGFNGVRATWSSLPAALGDLMVQAGNAMIRALGSALNAMTKMISDWFASINPVLAVFRAFGGELPKMPGIGGGVEMPEMPNPWEGRAAHVGATIGAHMDEAMGRDYVGMLGEMATGARDAATANSELAGALGEVDTSLGDIGGGGRGGGGGAAKAAKDAIDEVAEAARKAAQAAMDFAKEVVGGFISDLRSGLKQGQSFFEAFANAASRALDKIIDKLLNDVLDAIFQVNQGFGGMGGGGGILGLIGSIFGFAKGGYTGDGAASQVAGVVHGGEYVMSKPAVDSLGVGYLDALHSAAKGYRQGGYVPAYQSGGYVAPRVHAPANDKPQRVEVFVQSNDEKLRVFVRDEADGRIKEAAPSIASAGAAMAGKQVSDNMPGLVSNAQMRSL